MKNREQILCKKAKQGDQESGFELVDIFYRPIYQYLRRLCGNRQDAEDLTQDTFVKVWSSLESYKNGFKFSTWIYTIAYHVYVDWLRKKREGVWVTFQMNGGKNVLMTILAHLKKRLIDK